MTLTLAFLLHKRVNATQESINKCTSGALYIFRRDKTDQEPEPENSTNLIEIMPYRLVEPLTIKPIGMTQLPIILKSSQVNNLFIPKLLYTRIQSVMEILFVSCGCLFFLPLVPVPTDVTSGTSPSQRGKCRASSREKMHKMIEKRHNSKELPLSASASRKSRSAFNWLADFLL